MDLFSPSCCLDPVAWCQSRGVRSWALQPYLILFSIVYHTILHAGDVVSKRGLFWLMGLVQGCGSACGDGCLDFGRVRDKDGQRSSARYFRGRSTLTK